MYETQHYKEFVAIKFTYLSSTNLGTTYDAYFP
jgi:hypothetical protein